MSGRSCSAGALVRQIERRVACSKSLQRACHGRIKMQGERPRLLCIMRLLSRQMMPIAARVTRVGCFPTNLIDVPSWTMTRAFDR